MKSNPNPLEKEIEAQICAFARSLKCLVYKFTSPMRAAVPDRLLITPTGTVFFIETKRKGQKPTPAQEVEIEKIRATGVKVFVVDNVDDGKNVVREMAGVMEDACVCHRCDNRKCNNPAHLFIGTVKDNMHDRDRKGRARPVKGVDNSKAVLNEYQVQQVRLMWFIGKKRSKEIAAIFGTSRGCINEIVYGRNWKHLPYPKGIEMMDPVFN